MNHYFFIALQSVGVYFFILLLIRLFGKKELAQLSTIDLVFMLLISNAVQNAMVTAINDSDPAKATDFYGGLLAAFVLFMANFLLKTAFFYSKKLNKWVQGEPILLVYKGVARANNLRKAQISDDELAAVFREHGLAHISQVSLAVLEIDGNISVLSENIADKQTFRKQKQRKLHLKNG